ncbi:MAG: hypothetical protein WBG62_19335 [Cyclobacteriaceae bacterium]
MKFSITLYTLNIILLLLTACESDQELGGGYYYLPDYEAKDIGYPNGAVIYKSENKYVFSKIVITDKVVAVDRGDDFILVIQIPSDSLIDKTGKTIKTGGLSYYIIDKNNDVVIGPMDKNAFLKSRDKLGVPEDMEVIY